LKSQSAPCFRIRPQEARDHQQRQQAGKQEQMRCPETQVPVGQCGRSQRRQHGHDDFGEARKLPALGEIMRGTGGDEGRGTAEIDLVFGLISVTDDLGGIEIGVNGEENGDQCGNGKAGQGRRKVGDKAMQTVGDAHEDSVAISQLRLQCL
jgi:hypothetical protein